MIVTATPMRSPTAPRASVTRPASAPEEPKESVQIRPMTSLGQLGRTGADTGLKAVAGNLSGPIGLVGTMGAIEVVNTLVGHRLNALAIVPHDPHGLVGIATAPFLHGSLGHFANNAVGILLAGGMIAARDPKRFRDVSLITALTSGLGVWLTGGGPTVGASGVVYGYVGYTMARGFFDKKPLSIAMSAASLALFTGSLVGLLPGAPGISWQAHMFGFLGGVAAAAMLPGDGASRRA